MKRTKSLISQNLDQPFKMQIPFCQVAKHFLDYRCTGIHKNWPIILVLAFLIVSCWAIYSPSFPIPLNEKIG